MGSQSDYKTMKLAEKILTKVGVQYETKIISAHRTPKRMYEYAKLAVKNNIGVIIAGAGGSAHLPGMISALTSIPVLGVPKKSKKLKGLDSLLSIGTPNTGIGVKAEIIPGKWAEPPAPAIITAILFLTVELA